MNLNPFDAALLSEASYANFSDNTIRELQEVGFSLSQANDFADRWDVVYHQPNTPSGFSATLPQIH